MSSLTPGTEVHGTQNDVASSSSPSSQISHLNSLGFITLVEELDDVATVTRAEEAKRLIGRDEVETTTEGVVVVSACLP